MVGHFACVLFVCMLKGGAAGCVPGSGWPSSPLADGENCLLYADEADSFDDVLYGGTFAYAATTDCDNACASGACISGDIRNGGQVCGSFLEAGDGCTSNADCRGFTIAAGHGQCEVPATCVSGKCKAGGGSACSAVWTTSDGGNSLCASGTCLPSGTVMGQPRCATLAGWPTDYDCNQNPTPAPTLPPTSASVSGDPIVKINGHTVKIEFPFAESQLVWQDSKLQVFASAGVTTPDHKDQWFSDFTLFVHGRKAAQIEQKTQVMDNMDALSVVIYSAEKDHNGETIEIPGKYDIGDGSASLFLSVEPKDERLARKVVKVKSHGFDFSVGSQKAKKFLPDERKALKYSHLDIDLQRMDYAFVEKGIFAELWGLVPMSAKTANMIRKVHM